MGWFEFLLVCVALVLSYRLGISQGMAALDREFRDRMPDLQKETFERGYNCGVDRAVNYFTQTGSDVLRQLSACKSREDALKLVETMRQDVDRHVSVEK